MDLCLSDRAVQKVAQFAKRDAGFWRDIGEFGKDVIFGREDYGEWTQKLERALDEIGFSIFEVDKRDLIDWYEEGYSVHDAIQLALAES